MSNVDRDMIARAGHVTKQRRMSLKTKTVVC